MDRQVFKNRTFLLFVTLACAALLYQGLQLYYSVYFRSPVSCLFRVATMEWTKAGGLKVNERHETPSTHEEVAKLDLQKGDRLVALTDKGGQTFVLKGAVDVVAAMKAIRYGEPWAFLLVRTDDGGGETSHRLEVPALTAPPVTWKPGDLPGRLRLLFPLVLILTALFIAVAKPEDRHALMASMVFLGAAALVWRGGFMLFPDGLREPMTLLYIGLFSFATALYMRFFLLYPEPSLLDRKMPWLKSAGLAFGLVFSVWNLNWHTRENADWAAFQGFRASYGWIDIVLDLVFVGLFLVGFLSLVLNALQIRTADERRRLLILLAGSLGFLPALAAYIFIILGKADGLPHWAFYVTSVALLTFPVSFAYAVVKHRIFGIRLMIRKGLQFALLSRGFLIIEGVLLFMVFYFAAMPLLGKAMNGTGPEVLAIGTATVTLLTIFGIRRLNRAVMHRIERRFFRESYDARRILTDLARNVRRMTDQPDELMKAVTSTIFHSLHPDRVGIFLRGEEIVQLPEVDETRRELVRKSTGNGKDFYCCSHRSADGMGEKGTSGPSLFTAVLPSDCLIARRLEEGSKGDWEAVDVRLDDSHSWARAILTRDLEEEKRVVERCNIQLLVPLVAGGRLLGFISLGEKLSEEPYASEDRELLLAVAQQMADSLEHAQLLREGQQQAIMKREMEIAKAVQEKLFPHIACKVPSLDYSGTCKPARDVGGDYYDFLPGANRQMAIALGDISGKGVSAALLMASLQAMLRIHAGAHGADAEKAIGDINGLMCSSTDGNRFATLFYGIYDPARLTLSYVNAGHNPPIVLRRTPDAFEALRLQPTGTVLGVFPKVAFKKEVLRLSPGDVLVLFSDGVTEAMNEAEEFFGEDRLLALAARYANLPAEAMRDRILDEVERFAGGRAQSDDITLIVAKVAPEAAAQLPRFEAIRFTTEVN